MIVIATIVFNGLMTGCVEKDVYNPDAGKQPLPDPDEYFGFETRGDVKLLVNYNVPSFTALVEVYDEDPMVEGTSVKKEGVEAIFKTYTDNNGKYEGKMNIPTSVEKVYLCTETCGLPRCVEMKIKDNAVSFDMSVKQLRPSTRSYSFGETKPPYTIDRSKNLYSLCKWGEKGNLASSKDYIKSVNQVGDEKISDVTKRLKKFFNPYNIADVNNSSLFSAPEVTNIKIKEKTKLDVVFLDRDASYDNTFGYYFYKTSDRVGVNNVKKYIVFPNVTFSAYEGQLSILSCGNKVRLLYFDENGNAAEEFPEGYTVGWFLYADGYNGYKHDSDVKENEIRTKELRTSNEVMITQNGFVTVKDEKSGKTIIGVEDGANQSYCDLLFYVDATPEGSIDDPNRPVIKPDDGKEDPEPDPVEPLKGTLAFEDIWPSGGDYDMNDVIVEYRREVSFNTKNMVTKIVDTFTPVHDGATFLNAFAYQIDPGQLGKVTSTDVKVENETSSIIVTPNVKESIGKTYTITREFNASFKKDDLKGYNPYIIVKYADGQKDRAEVHLPKHKATSLANQSLIGTNKDAYYIDREGAYPFAIDIPVLGFKPVTERQRIDSEYPDFTKWADSKGAKYTDWYENYTGPRK
ncbi:LruC domain-containing protein [Bacteroides stercorirosoris]|uniref:LruC domain-containing protein n=2 Tax=Bacteroides stercorirosoris TaxID=871324 RepID=A0A1M6GWA7_9BACE|nr:LruC domain-containing protein [Bacteroides stercorirosoris]